MAVYICQASIDEHGKAHGGAAGDQTGRELNRREWYNGNWSVLLRPRDKVVARKMVRFCEGVVAGNMCGYDQWQRNTLRDAARAVGWDGKMIKVKCETDCSAFISVAAEAAGVYMDGAYTRLANGTLNAPVTQNMRKKFCETGAFIAYTDKSYLTSVDYLEAGDILVRESGHTCIVVTDGPKAIRPTYGSDIVEERYAKVYSPPKILRVDTKVDPLNARSEPGVSGTIIGTFERGEIVSADTEATLTDGSVWMRCKGKTVTGWASAKYLAEVKDTPTATEGEDSDMYPEAFVTHVTPEQSACIIDKGREWYAKLPESEWALASGEYEEAVALGITDGSRPRDILTREEGAIMAKRAFRLAEESAYQRILKKLEDDGR